MARDLDLDPPPVQSSRQLAEIRPRNSRAPTPLCRKFFAHAIEVNSRGCRVSPDRLRGPPPSRVFLRLGGGLCLSDFRRLLKIHNDLVTSDLAPETIIYRHIPTQTASPVLSVSSVVRVLLVKSAMPTSNSFSRHRSR